MIGCLQDSAVLDKKEKELEKNTAENANAVQHRQEVKTAYETAQKKLQQESAGLASNDSGEDATLNDQLLGMYVMYMVSGNVVSILTLFSKDVT